MVAAYDDYPDGKLELGEFSELVRDIEAAPGVEERKGETAEEALERRLGALEVELSPLPCVAGRSLFASSWVPGARTTGRSVAECESGK